MAEPDTGELDRFTFKPILLAVSGLAACLLALLAAGRFTTTLTVVFVIAAFAIEGLKQLWTFRLAQLGATTIGGILFLAGVGGLMRWGNDIQFGLMRAVYNSQIASLPQAARQHHHWPWDGGLGWDVSLYYSAEAATGDTEEAMQAGCSMRRRHMGGHFSLGTLACNAVSNDRQTSS